MLTFEKGTVRVKCEVKQKRKGISNCGNSMYSSGGKTGHGSLRNS